MWRMRGATRDGSPTEVPGIEIEEGATRSRIIQEAGRLMARARRPRLLASLQRDFESDATLHGIEGTEKWGASAAELPQASALEMPLFSFGRLGETETGSEILSINAYDESGEVEAIAFHPPEVLIADVSGLGEIEIVGSAGLEGVPEEFEQRHFVEWRAYLGDGTLVTEGTSEFGPPSHSDRTARVRLLGSNGLLVARILRWMGKEKTPSTDRSFVRRLDDFRARYPEVVAESPDITGQHPFAGSSDPALVFVHGTFSCAIPALAILRPLNIQAFRFEHDTFKSVSDNAELLVHGVRQLHRPSRLHLVGHSRGGLVARLAARELSKDHDVVVRTYGTPHLGTRVANAGGRAWDALLSMGRLTVGGAIPWDPASLAAKTLFRSRNLPEGLNVMRTDSDMLKSLHFGSEQYPLRCYAGDYDAGSLEDGFCAQTLGAVADGLFEGPNDLVVSTSSALAGGTGRTVSCDHFSYFSIRELRDELQRL